MSIYIYRLNFVYYKLFLQDLNYIITNIKQIKQKRHERLFKTIKTLMVVKRIQILVPAI